jgi:ureidoglycolate amidohydrolase
MNLRVNAARLAAELEALAQFSDSPYPSVTRVVFSETDSQARAWLKQKCVASGLRMREDAVGNTFARWEAGEETVGTGSHIDAIPNAGRFDGTVGVLGGLEAIRSLQESGFSPKRSIELLLFTSEEPTRFGIGCLGSRMLGGVLSAERALTLKDREGANLDHLRKGAGFDGTLESVQLAAGHYAAFVELHIEQGPLLEASHTDIGIVTHIAAPAAMRVTMEGNGGHAGALLMRDRRDAFVGGAELAMAVEAAALATGSPDSVATTGICEVFPGAVNSVPSKVKLEMDVRDTNLQRRDGMLSEIRAAGNAIASRRKLKLDMEILTSDAPAACDPAVVEMIEQVCQELGLSHRRMISRAYHDSLFMSRLAPTSMIFIPCHLGYSHRPDEFSSNDAIEKGVTVLARTLSQLAS